MLVRRATVALVLLGFAACGDKRKPEPVIPEGDPVAAAVAFASPSVRLGSSTQAAVVLKDADSAVVDSGAVYAFGDTVVWSVRDAAIARVDADGRVTGLALGTTRVVAAVGRLRGEGEITVTGELHPRIDSIVPSRLVAGAPATIYGADFVPVRTANLLLIGETPATVTSASATRLAVVVPETDCAPAAHRDVTLWASGASATVPDVAVAPSATPLMMPASSVRVLAGEAAVGCVQLAASEAPSEYVIVAGNANPLPDAFAAQTVELALGDSVALGMGRYGVAAPAPLTGRLASAASGGSGAGALALASLAGAAGFSAPDHQARLIARQALPSPRLAAPSASVRAGGTRALSLSAASAAVAAEPAVGSVLTLRVPKLVKDVCADYDSVQATVRFVGRRAIFAQDVNAPAGFTDADYAALSAEMDDVVYPVDSSYFGTPTDLDANGRVIVLFTPLINRMTPRRSASIQGGYFWSGDLFPRAKCRQSNVGEVFYLLTPDPAAQYGDARPVVETRLRTRGTLAHELQHMINAGSRITRGAPAFESVWLDEALSHFAEEAVGRARRGFGDFQRLSYADVTADADDFESYFRQNLLRVEAWMRSTATFSPTSEMVAGAVEGRGAAWSLLRYATDHYAGGDARAFTRRLVASSDTSVANFVARAGVPFDSLVAGWLVASVADDVALASAVERHAFRSWNLGDALTLGGARAYPLAATPLDPEGVFPTVLYSGTGAYYRLTFPGSRTPAASFRLIGGNGLPAKFAGARLYVIRVR